MIKRSREIATPPELPAPTPIVESAPTGESAPKSSKKILGGILVALVIGLAIGCIIGSLPISGYTNRISSLQDQLQSKEQQYNSLNTAFQNLQNEHNNLQRNYDDLTASYGDMEADYQGALKVPYTTIEEGDVVWAFRTTEGTIQEWNMPLGTYTYYVEKTKPTQYHYLNVDGGTITIRNMELFVQPDFFSNVIHDLTYGNTARDFVQEVFNSRKQLTTYSSDITDTPQWSAETLTKGTGDCEDFAILMGSLLMSGNQYAGYGMSVQMVYMDTNNPTDPQTVNHVMLYVKYSDGGTQLVDSTSTSVLSPWPRVVGWFYDL